jgi:hypothetical protein
MIASCESCGEDFLTESDPYVVRPTKNGDKLYCYCHIKGFDEVKSKADKLQDENTNLNEKVQKTKTFLKERLYYSADDKDELFVNRYCLMALLEELEKE